MDEYEVTFCVDMKVEDCTREFVNRVYECRDDLFVYCTEGNVFIDAIVESGCDGMLHEEIAKIEDTLESIGLEFMIVLEQMDIVVDSKTNEEALSAENKKLKEENAALKLQLQCYLEG